MLVHSHHEINAHKRDARGILRQVVERCEVALAKGDARAIGECAAQARATARDFDAGDVLAKQLRAIEHEAARMHVYGVERMRSRLAYARALLPLSFDWWR
jgi:hypothetical protein